MALGVIPPLCATLGPVLAGPEGCSRGRWRSGPSKWRHTAAPEGRGQGAPRTCRCIETPRCSRGQGCSCRVREHHAPVGALRPTVLEVIIGLKGVREHHAPVGALRPVKDVAAAVAATRQGAPRTCRCIETRSRERGQRCTPVREHRAPVGALRHDERHPDGPFEAGQGAPRTCRCIETPTTAPTAAAAATSGSTTHL